jgi:uncharacterized protein (TIGR02453 family)
MALRFTGFPLEGLEFFEELEANNDRGWFQAHKAVYEEACRIPMEALLAEIEPEFGEGKVFRIYRDVRFSKDKSPYKTNIAAVVGSRHYLSLSPEGLYAGSGGYMLDGESLTRYRDAVVDETSGKALDRIVAAAEKKGYDIGAHDELKTAPKGYPRDHPRARLLRYKGIFMGRLFEPGDWLATRRAMSKVTTALRDARPLNDWIDKHVA